MTKEASDMKQIGERMRAIRERRGYTIEEVARHLGMGRVNYNRKELGGVIVSAPEIAELSRLMQVSVSYFYGEDELDDISRRDVVQFFDGLPENIKRVELEHLRALHNAHAAEVGPKPIGGERAE